jgi:hypothetical protein
MVGLAARTLSFALALSIQVQADDATHLWEQIEALHGQNTLLSNKCVSNKVKAWHERLPSQVKEVVVPKRAR